jgi:hypothetical protein
MGKRDKELEYGACPICDGLGYGQHFLTENSYQIVRCKLCGLNPSPLSRQKNGLYLVD